MRNIHVRTLGDSRPAQSRLACRFDHGSPCLWILGTLVTQCLPSELAILLVGSVVIDRFSRRAMGFYIWRSRPTSRAVQASLNRTIQETGAKPNYLISDKGVQFWCDDYKAWCKSQGIESRFGAVGQHGSIAVVERFIRTLKECGTRQFTISPWRQHLRDHIDWFLTWHNEFRPHITLEGKTPNEVYDASPPANEEPRIEPRPGWRVGAPCAKPHVPVDDEPGTVFQLQVAYHVEQKHLPLVTLRRAA